MDANGAGIRATQCQSLFSNYRNKENQDAVLAFRVLLSNGGDTSMENLTALWKVQDVLIRVRKGAERTRDGHQGRLPGGGVT